MAQEIFKKAVEGFLPTALPTLLEKIDEYNIGKVLVYSKKPSSLLCLRKHKLDFAGVSLQSLLTDAEELSVTTASSYLFDTSKEIVSKSYDIDGDAELDVSDALLKLVSAKLDAKVEGGVKANIKVTTDFGKISHISTDLVTTTMTKQLHVRPDHPIVRRAVANGGTMFVISSIYEGEHCNLSATVSKTMKEDADAGGGAKDTKADLKEDAEYHKDSNLVVSRDQPTPLAYVLMKLKVTSRGVVTALPDQHHSSIWDVSYPYPVALSEIPSAKTKTDTANGGKGDCTKAKEDTSTTGKDKGPDTAKPDTDPAKTETKADVSPGSGATNPSIQ